MNWVRHLFRPRAAAESDCSPLLYEEEGPAEPPRASAYSRALTPDGKLLALNPERAGRRTLPPRPGGANMEHARRAIARMRREMG